MNVSVAICTYNGELFIGEQLLSIFAQNSKVNEIIICDDCSSDRTVLLIEEIIERSQARITLLRNAQNMGAIRSFEKCIQACTGDVVFLSDQDDIWLPTKVARLLGAFESDPAALAVFSDGELIDEVGNRLGSTLWQKWGFTSGLQREWLDNDFVFAELLPNHNRITGATLAFKRALMPYIVPFELPQGYWHDSWIGLAAAGLGGLRFIEEPTILYRIHPNQQVGVTGGWDKRYAPVSVQHYFDKAAALFPNKSEIIRRQMRAYIKADAPTGWRRVVGLPRRAISLLKRLVG